MKAFESRMMRIGSTIDELINDQEIDILKDQLKVLKNKVKFNNDTISEIKNR